MPRRPGPAIPGSCGGTSRGSRRLSNRSVRERQVWWRTWPIKGAAATEAIDGIPAYWTLPGWPPGDRPLSVETGRSPFARHKSLGWELGTEATEATECNLLLSSASSASINVIGSRQRLMHKRGNNWMLVFHVGLIIVCRPPCELIAGNCRSRTELEVQE
jgi:hypothetical protein